MDTTAAPLQQLAGRRQAHVAAVPHPGRGHINPMLSLCRLLASRGLLVTVVLTDEWLRLLRSDPRTRPHSNFRMRAIPDGVIPPERVRGENFRAFIHAVRTKMGPAVQELITTMEPSVDAIVADSILPWAANLGDAINVPVSSFWTQAAAVLLSLVRFGELDDSEQAVANLTGQGSPPLNFIPRASNFFSNDSRQTIVSRFIDNISWYKSCKGIIMTTFYELEREALDDLRSKIHVPVYTLGPSIPFMTLATSGTAAAAVDGEEEKEDYISWLDSQRRSSVLYISLGSFAPISSEQMDELVAGVQVSGLLCLWVARGEHQSLQAASSKIGMVIPWCDQLRVLCHSSVGAFLTHCGWNSTLEGIYAGVPMITFPLIWDQYPDSKLIVDEWKVGLRLKNEEINEESIVGRERIAEVVKRIMDVDGDESHKIRRRAAELKTKCHGALGFGGSMLANLDGFVQDVLQSSTEGRWHERSVSDIIRKNSGL